MTLNNYQEAALSTAVYSKDYIIVYPAFGLCSEAGEVAGKVKKVLRDNDGYFTREKRNEIMKELGDVLWYVSVLANDLGFSLEEVAVANITKLADRADRNKLQGSGDER